MAKITLKGEEINTEGTLPEVGSEAPLFTLTGPDLGVVAASDYKGKKYVVSISPSLDTGICQMTAKRFNKEVAEGLGTPIIHVTKDLPFATKRFCEAEGLEDVVVASDYKNSDFADAYGTLIVDGPMAGLHSRAIVVVDEDGKVIYTEQVPEIVQEPDYEAALAILK